MNVTESRFKNRQLHIEDYLQMVSAEQKEYAEVFDYSKITEKSGVITDYWTNNLLDLILRKDNLNSAYKQVKKNKHIFLLLFSFVFFCFLLFFLSWKLLISAFLCVCLSCPAVIFPFFRNFVSFILLPERLL